MNRKRHLVWAPAGHDVLRSACGMMILEPEHNPTREIRECDCRRCINAAKTFGKPGEWALAGYHFVAEPAQKD